MEKELRVFFKNGEWHCELWSDFEEPFHTGKQFEDKVTASIFPKLISEIVNKNWLELLKQ